MKTIFADLKKVQVLKRVLMDLLEALDNNKVCEAFDIIYSLIFYNFYNFQKK